MKKTLWNDEMDYGESIRQHFSLAGGKSSGEGHNKLSKLGYDYVNYITGLIVTEDQVRIEQCACIELKSWW